MLMKTQQLTSASGPVKEVSEAEAEGSWVEDGVDGYDGGPTDLEAGLLMLEANHRATLARMRGIIKMGDKRQKQLVQRLQEGCQSWANKSIAVQQQPHEFEGKPVGFYKKDESELVKFHCRCLSHPVEGSTDDTASGGERSESNLVGTHSPIFKCSPSEDDQLSFETSRGEDLRLLGLFNDLAIRRHSRPETEKIQALLTVPLPPPSRPKRHSKQKVTQSLSTLSKQSTRSNSLDSLYNPSSLSLSKPLGSVITSKEKMDPETGQWVTIREGEHNCHESRPLQETNSDVSELDITTCTPVKYRARNTQHITCGIAIHHECSDDEVTPKAQRMHSTGREHLEYTNEDTDLEDGKVSAEKGKELDELRALAASVDLDGEGGVSLLLADS